MSSTVTAKQGRSPASASTVSLAAWTSQGPWRPRNDDGWWADVDLGLALIADGVGSWSASADAVALLLEQAQKLGPAWAQGSEHALVDGLLELNRLVGRHWGWGARRAGATVTLLRWQQDQLRIAHLGDTSLWRVNAQACECLTPVQRAFHPHWQRERLTEFLGRVPFPPIQLVRETWAPGDRLLLATDGVTDEFTEAELHTLMLNQPTPQATLERLASVLERRQAQDNATALVLHYQATR